MGGKRSLLSRGGSDCCLERKERPGLDMFRLEPGGILSRPRSIDRAVSEWFLPWSGRLVWIAGAAD